MVRLFESSGKPFKFESVSEEQKFQQKSVRVIGHDGKMIGIVPFTQGRLEAQKLGMHLAVVQGNTDPPVVKMVTLVDMTKVGSGRAESITSG